MLLGILKARRPLCHELEKWLMLSFVIKLGQVVSHDFDALLIILERFLWLYLLEQSCDFKVSIIVLWIQLTNMFEEFESLILILWGTRLPSFDLC